MNNEIKAILGIGIVTVLVLVGAVTLLSKPSQPTSNTKLDNKLLVKEDSNKIATDSAKVTIVEFADFQCPACAAVHPAVKQILNDYKGKVNFVFRHFPLPQHKNALIAASAAEAAGEQGKFWEMENLLFENQDKWSESDKAKEIFLTYAKELGLDKDKFKSAIEGNKFTSKITGDKDDGQALGVNSTPTFFINGQKFSESASYANLKNKIDELNK